MWQNGYDWFPPWERPTLFLPSHSTLKTSSCLNVGVGVHVSLGVSTAQAKLKCKFFPPSTYRLP